MGSSESVKTKSGRSNKGLSPCRLCASTTAPKADAHVFSKAIFNEVKAAQGNEEYLWAIDRNGAKPPRRVRIGEYDQEILCQACESKHQVVDHKGIEALFRKPYKAVRVYGKAQLILRRSDEANARHIRDFLYFILLRAEWSQREAYANVQLEPEVEAHLRRTLEEGVEPTDLPVPIVLVQHGLAMPDFVPTTAIYHGIIAVRPFATYNVYQISVGGICAWVYAGKGSPPFEEKTAHLGLHDEKKVYILRSPEADAAHEDWVAGLLADRIRTGGKKWNP